MSVSRKILASISALLLAVCVTVSPYAQARQAAYANPIVLTSAQMAGAALATVAALYGIDLIGDSSSDLPAAFNSINKGYNEFMDGMAGAGAEILMDTVSAWDKTLTQDIDWSAIGSYAQQAKDTVAAWGKTGLINLNDLSMNGAFGLLPAFLSLWLVDQIQAGAVTGDFLIDGINVRVGDNPLGSKKLVNIGYQYPVSDKGIDGLYLIYTSTSDIYFYWHSTTGTWRSSTTLRSEYFYPDGTSAMKDLGISLSYKELVLSSENVFTFSSMYAYKASFRKSNVVVAEYANGQLTGDLVTDNPDVNLGHDWWDDARDRADMLNPAAGASVIGSDAVIDGNYIKDRGSVGVLTDWTGVDSWADALARSHAGVIEGALDGTISTTQTGTAVDTATGELVNGSAGELLKPGSGTSVALPIPGLFDGVVDAVSDKFPFCIPGDLHRFFVAMSAPPVAPAFDWVFPLSHVGLSDVTIRIDLAPFDQVAFILRVGLSITFTIGAIFLSIRLLNMWGGD